MNQNTEIVDKFIPVGFAFSTDNNFMLYFTSERDSMTRYQIQVYNTVENKTISQIEYSPGSETFKVTNEYLYSYNYEKQVISSRKIDNLSEVKYFSIK
jgi:hypothetical protein